VADSPPRVPVTRESLKLNGASKLAMVEGTGGLSTTNESGIGNSMPSVVEQDEGNDGGFEKEWKRGRSSSSVSRPEKKDTLDVRDIVEGESLGSSAPAPRPQRPSEADRHAPNSSSRGPKASVSDTGAIDLQVPSSVPPASLSAPTMLPSASTREASGSVSATPTVHDHHAGHLQNASIAGVASSSNTRPSVDRERDRLLAPAYGEMNGGSHSLSPPQSAQSMITSTSSPMRSTRTRSHSADMAARRLREALSDAQTRGASSLKIEAPIADAILKSVDLSHETLSGLKGELDHARVSESPRPMLCARLTLCFCD
jgi:hypothetical protein